MKKLRICFLCFCLFFSGIIITPAADYTVPNARLGQEVPVSGAALSAMEDVSMKVEVNAKAAVLMEGATGQILMAMNENEQLYPASVTKIMSMILICEALDAGKINLTDTVAATENACAKGGSQIWLEPGEEMTVDDLLKATAVYSANDACTLLGEVVAGSEEAFVQMMNEKAQQLGMSNTHFVNCTGLDDTTEEHLTTAYDIALMSRELLKHDIIKNYSTIWMDSLRGGETQLVNTNKLVRTYKGITGLKTGTTDKAGCCVSATAERDGLSLIAVVLGSDNSNDRFNGAKAMLDWGFANYECYTPTITEEELPEISVLGALQEKMTPALPEFSPILVARGQSSAITVEITTVENVKAPVEAGQKVGSIRFFAEEEVLCEYDLLCGEDIPKLSFWEFMGKILQSIGKEETAESDSQ